MSYIKKISRKYVFPSITRIGAEKFFSTISNNSILNIFYHGVVNKDSTFFNPRHITATQFEKQLIYFKQNFNIISLHDAFLIHKGLLKNNSPKKQLTISFDDGYKNNLNLAAPILKKHNIPTTFFISTICLDNDNVILWDDKISLINYFLKPAIIKIDKLDFKFKGKEFINEDLQINLDNHLKSLPPSQRDEALNEIEQTHNLNKFRHYLEPEIFELMNKKEIIKLASYDIFKIQSHSHRHYNLANLNNEDMLTELSVSKNKLESLLNNDIQSIAFPYGSYNKKTKELCLSLGYDEMLAVNYKLKEDLSDINILHRFGISSTTTFESNIISTNLAFLKKGYN